jgi:hypothetical protein
VTVGKPTAYVRRTGACVAPVFLYACLILFASCARIKGTPSASSDVYPTWFMALPEGPHAVGYSPTQEYEESAIRQAVSFAARALAAEDLVVVNGGRGSIVGPFGTFLAGSDLEETVDQARVAEYDESGRLLRASNLAGMTVVLLGRPGTGHGNTILDDEAMVTTAAEPPDWIRYPPERPGYAFSVGVAADNEYEATNWKLAEKHARMRLALNRWAKVQTMNKDGVVSLVETEAVALHGVRVVRRWRDPGNGACFVLARMQR